MQKKAKKMRKNLHNSKKSSTFAVRFEPLAIALGLFPNSSKCSKP